MATEVLIAVIISVVVMGGIYLLVGLRLWSLKRSKDEPADDYSLVNATRMVGAMFGLLGGFMVASLWSGQSDLDNRLTDEVASLAGLVSQFALASPQLAVEAGKLQEDYLIALRDDEIRGDDNASRALRFRPSPRAADVVNRFEALSAEIAPRADRTYVAFLENRINRLAWQPPIGRISLVPAVVMTILMLFLVGFQQPGPSRLTTWLAALLSGVAIAVVAIMVATLLDADAGDDRRAAVITEYIETIR